MTGVAVRWARSLIACLTLLAMSAPACSSADVLVILPNDGDPHEVPGYEQLTAVRNGAVAELGFADIVGINTPTPMSIPHAIDVLRPALERAA